MNTHPYNTHIPVHAHTCTHMHTHAHKAHTNQQKQAETSTAVQLYPLDAVVSLRFQENRIFLTRGLVCPFAANKVESDRQTVPFQTTC